MVQGRRDSRLRPPDTGGWAPVAGPFCAIANEEPATSTAATIIRFFWVVITRPLMLEPPLQVRTPFTVFCSCDGASAFDGSETNLAPRSTRANQLTPPNASVVGKAIK